MSISINRHNLLGTLLFAMCLLVSAPSQAHWGGWHGGWHGGWGWTGVYIGGPAYYGPYYNYCGWVGGHRTHRGYWVPPRRVCWY